MKKVSTMTQLYQETILDKDTKHHKEVLADARTSMATLRTLLVARPRSTNSVAYA